MVSEIAETLQGAGSNEMLRADPAVQAAAGQIPIAMRVNGERHLRLAAQIDAAVTPNELIDPGALAASFRL
jgi:hypothetical protein